MKLREYANRFPDGNLLGAIIYIQNKMPYRMALKLFSGGMAWFVDEKEYPNGKVFFVETEANDLLDCEVQGWANYATPLMENDYIWLKEPKRKEQVTQVKEGDGSPYPIVTTDGQYKWSEISMVNKNLVK